MYHHQSKKSSGSRRDNKENDWNNNAQLSRSSSKSSQEVQCKYHPKKKLKYKILSIPFHCGRQPHQLCDEVCSKCAVMLVAQGYKVQETCQDVIQQRQEEIQLFLCQVQTCFQNLDHTETALLDKRADLAKFCDTQRIKVKEHYQKLFTAIEARMNEQLYMLEEAQSQLTSAYDTKHHDLKEQHADLLQMYSDIEVNLESIITTIDQLPYKQIMGQYLRRIQTVMQHIGRLEQEQVCLVRVFLKKSKNQELVLGGLVEDSELEVRAVQTSMIKSTTPNNNNNNYSNNNNITNTNSRVLLSPSPSTGINSQIAFIEGSPTPPTNDQSLILHKQRSLSQPTYGAQKYLDILRKVNENQLKTNDYYTSLLRNKKSSDMDCGEQMLSQTPSQRNSPKYFSPKFK